MCSIRFWWHHHNIAPITKTTICKCRYWVWKVVVCFLSLSNNHNFFHLFVCLLCWSSHNAIYIVPLSLSRFTAFDSRCRRIFTVHTTAQIKSYLKWGMWHGTKWSTVSTLDHRISFFGAGFDVKFGKQQQQQKTRWTNKWMQNNEIECIRFGRMSHRHICGGIRRLSNVRRTHFK